MRPNNHELPMNGLANQVTRLFNFHPHLKQARLKVRDDQGKIVLSGTVGSYYEKQIAQESLRDVPGIESIDNSIEVSWR